MQSLKDSKDVPKGMQSLVCSSVGVSSASPSFLHHIIVSFRITLHHTSYRINSKKRLNTKQIFGNTLVKENVLRHEANFGKYVFIGLTKGGVSFFTKHEKKVRCFFSPKAKKWYVRKFHAL
jgi:hypothetical protein